MQMPSSHLGFTPTSIPRHCLQCLQRTNSSQELSPTHRPIVNMAFWFLLRPKPESPWKSAGADSASAAPMGGQAPRQRLAATCASTRQVGTAPGVCQPASAVPVRTPQKPASRARTGGIWGPSGKTRTPVSGLPCGKQTLCHFRRPSACFRGSPLRRGAAHTTSMFDAGAVPLTVTSAALARPAPPHPSRPDRHASATTLSCASGARALPVSYCLTA